MARGKKKETLTSEERQAIYCGNAIRLLGWPL